MERAKEAIAPLRETNPEKSEIAVLEKDVQRKRRGEFARASDAVAGSRFHQVVLRAALWLLDGKWSQVKGHAAERRAKSITAVAADILDRRARKITKKTKRLQELDALHRHKLRIAVKKFRYGCEFFENLFEHAKVHKRYERALKELQDSLGKLNDIEVHGRRGSRVANPRKRGRQQSQKAYAMGLLTGQEQAKCRELVTRAIRAGRRIADASPFW